MTAVNMGFLMRQNKSAVAEVRRYRRRTDELSARLTSSEQRERARGDTVAMLARHWAQLEADLVALAGPPSAADLADAADAGAPAADGDGDDGGAPTTLPSGQTPGPSRPGTKYPVRGNPSLRSMSSSTSSRPKEPKLALSDSVRHVLLFMVEVRD